jgi:hypothetical protein
MLLTQTQRLYNGTRYAEKHGNDLAAIRRIKKHRHRGQPYVHVVLLVSFRVLTPPIAGLVCSGYVYSHSVHKWVVCHFEVGMFYVLEVDCTVGLSSSPMVGG